MRERRIGGGTRSTISMIVVAATAGLVATAAPAGAAGPAGWTAANSVATGDQDGAAVATNRSGDVAVAWRTTGTAPTRPTTPTARSTCGSSAPAPPLTRYGCPPAERPE